MSKKFGFDLLEEQLIEVSTELISSSVSYDRDDAHATGWTPIERLFYCALSGMIHHTCTLFDRVGGIEDAPTEGTDGILYISAQHQLEGWRVDFLIAVSTKVGLKRLIVECDGHDFHERTKEQAAKDRERDRWAQLNGFEVFRFTGSELWRDPYACANQVITWATGKVCAS